MWSLGRDKPCDRFVAVRAFRRASGRHPAIPRIGFETKEKRDSRTLAWSAGGGPAGVGVGEAPGPEGECGGFGGERSGLSAGWVMAAIAGASSAGCTPRAEAMAMIRE